MSNMEIYNSLLIDKVALTFPVEKDYRLNILKNFNDKDFKKKYNIETMPDEDGNRYKNNYQLKMNNEGSAFISTYPINTNHNFMRIEYSPHNLGREGNLGLRDILLYLLGRERVMTLYFMSKVNRLDLTLDIKNFPHDLFPHKAKATYSKIYRTEDTGKIESHVIGSEKSDIHIIIYDKNREQGIASDRSYQRIERGCKNFCVNGH